MSTTSKPQQTVGRSIWRFPHQVADKLDPVVALDPSCFSHVDKRSNISTQCAAQVADKLDLVVTLGGDGTVLWTGALLGTGPVPPLVPFALGSLGFMTPFPLDTMPTVLSSVRRPARAPCTLAAALTRCACPVEDCLAEAVLPERLAIPGHHPLQQNKLVLECPSDAATMLNVDVGLTALLRC